MKHIDKSLTRLVLNAYYNNAQSFCERFDLC